MKRKLIHSKKKNMTIRLVGALNKNERQMDLTYFFLPFHEKKIS